ncbi:MAG: T9SS type A sorting domain-containing protein [bacterium]|nr:T9SS type A sorting domain-containing protein [bacterium]
MRIRSAVEAQFGDTLLQAIEIFQPTLYISMTPELDTLYLGQTVQLHVTGTHISEHIGEQVIVVVDRDGVYQSIDETDVPGVIDYELSGNPHDHVRFRAFIAGDQELNSATNAFVLRAPVFGWSSVPGGDVYSGDAMTLAWTSLGIESPVEIARLDESGESILAQDLADDSWLWNVTPPRGETRLIVRVMNDPQWSDTCEPFTVRVPQLTWLSPNESATDTSGQELNLSWEALDGASPVLLEVTFDGLGWEMIASSLVDDSYLYSLPYRSGEALQFRVTSVDHPNISAVSPTRTLVARMLVIDAGDDDTWYVGQQRWVRWSRELAPGEVALEVSYGDRAEGNWSNVTTTELDSFLWTVAGPATEFAALRVRLAGESAVFDTTDVPIAIHLPSVTVTEPNNGGSYDVDTEIRIRWQSEGLPSGVSIGLWRGAPVNRLDTLYVATENDGEEFWTITGPAADSCYVIITAENDSSIHDLSDVPFVIHGGTAADPRTGAVPQELAMGLPYPNPFNATLTVPFDLPQPAHVQISVFDILGREVAKLVNEQRPAGFLRVGWDAASVSSGMYFVRMTSTDFSDVRRVQLLK